MRLIDESVIEGGHLTPEERIALQAEEIKQLQQENEQLRAQVAKMREALIECVNALELCTHDELCKIAVSPYDIDLAGFELNGRRVFYVRKNQGNH